MVKKLETSKVQNAFMECQSLCSRPSLSCSKAQNGYAMRCFYRNTHSSYSGATLHGMNQLVEGPLNNESFYLILMFLYKICNHEGPQ